MNARIQRGLLGLKLLLALLALAWAWHGGQWALGLLAAALLMSVGGIVIWLSFAALPFINRAKHGGGEAAAFSPASLLRAWAREWLAYERVFSWQQPFAASRYPDYLPGGGGRRAVLLVHGFSCNRGLWNPWMRRLREQETPFLALTLEPAYGSIDAYAEQIEAGVQALATLGGPPPVIVAHSMGGLAVRAWLRRYGATAPGTARFARVMTLGSPHAGTLMASFSPALNARQMRRHSAWLAELARHEGGEFGGRIDCYFSYFDQVVCPAPTAILAGARAIEVAGCGHLSLLFEPAIFADLQQLLGEKKP